MTNRLDQVAECASNSFAWKVGRTVEKSLQGWQCAVGLLIVFAGVKSVKVYNQQLELASTISAAGDIKKCISALKAVTRDLGWMKLGKVFISADQKKIDNRAPDAHDWHKGSLGKQIFIIPTHFLAIPRVAEIFGLCELGQWGSWISSVSNNLWLLGMGCECIDSWTRVANEHESRPEKPVPYGRTGATLDFAHAFCAVALKGVAPDWLSNIPGLAHAGYWIVGAWKLAP